MSCIQNAKARMDLSNCVLLQINIIGEGVNHFCIGRKYFSEAQAAEKRRSNSLRMLYPTAIVTAAYWHHF